MLSEAELGRWLGCSEAFGAARGSPSRLHPLKGRAALPRPPARSLELEGRLFRTWPQRTDGLCKAVATSRRKSRGSPHHCATKGQVPTSAG